MKQAKKPMTEPEPRDVGAPVYAIVKYRSEDT